MRTLLAFAPLLLLAACSEHPLAGAWAPEGKPDTTFEFQTGGDQLMVHIDRPDGSHGHGENATYTWTGGKLSMQWEDGGKKHSWSGAFENGKLALTSADGAKMTLVPAKSAHH